MQVTFIIPARNEERRLPRVLESIREQAALLSPYEVMVVDHGSNDKTEEVASGMGAKVITQQGGTVAAARNQGARLAAGSVLVFLDADIILTPEWRLNIERVFRALAEDPLVVHGSWVGVSRQPSWIERFWFQPLERQVHSHVNSGHMIMSKVLFKRIGGFDERLETGEDYDLSQRVLEIGGSICNDPALAVIHEGYPKTLCGFFKRELWHGRGDWASPAAALRSPVVRLAMAVLALSLIAIAAAILGRGWVALMSSAGAGGICLAAAWRKYRSLPPAMMATDAILYYFYFIARAGAWLPMLIDRIYRCRRPEKPGSYKRQT